MNTITTTTTNNRRSQRRSKRNGTGKTVVQTVIRKNKDNGPRPPGLGVSRTARRKRNLRAAVGPSLGNRSVYWNRYHGSMMNGASMATVNSFNKTLQSLFYPEHGIHRGIANGMESSGLSMFQGSFDHVPAAPNGALLFSFTPSAFNTPVVLGNQNFMNIAGGTDFSAASAAFAAAATSTQVGGPFVTTNPSQDARIVSASLTIIPSGQLLTRSGEGKIGFGSRITLNDGNRSGIDNFAISQAWDGLNSMSLHWAPSVDEQVFRSGNYSASVDFAGFMAYLIFPPGSSLSFRFEWKVGIEYIPTIAYRPYVDRRPPDCTFDTYYYINHAVQAYWIPLMIDTFDNYRQRLGMSLPHNVGGSQGIHVTSAGSSGVGFRNPAMANYQDWDSIIEEEKLEEEEGFLGCGPLSRITGENFCAAPLGSALNMGVKAFNQATRRGGGGYNSYQRIMG